MTPEEDCVKYIHIQTFRLDSTPAIYVLLPITISIGSCRVEDHSRQNTGLEVTPCI